MADLNSTPRTWIAGEIPTATTFNTEVRDALTNLQSSWTSYTPTLTATTTSPTMGTSNSVTGSYRRIGKTIMGQFRIVFGTSGAAAGSGTYMVALPVTPVTQTRVIGSGYIFDSSTSDVWTYSLRILSSTPTVGRMIATSTTTVEFSDAFPFTWSNNDEISGQFFYEAA